MSSCIARTACGCDSRESKRGYAEISGVWKALAYMGSTSDRQIWRRPDYRGVVESRDTKAEVRRVHFFSSQQQYLGDKMQSMSIDYQS